MRYGTYIYLVLCALFTVSCSVVPAQIKKEAAAPVPFPDLLRDTNQYIGKTVILAGYIIETKNLPDKTLITVLETPPGVSDEPKARDKSQGRFIISQKGFLDPEIYRKDRGITVAGRVMGVEDTKAEQCPNRCLVIENRDIYLWPEYAYGEREPGWYRNYWYPYHYWYGTLPQVLY